LGRFAADQPAAADPAVLSLPVLLASVLLAFLTTIVFGVLPAVRTALPDRGGTLLQSLRQGERAGTGNRGRARTLLAATEIALAVVLLLGATLLLRSFAKLLEVDPGFRPAHLLSLQIALPANIYADGNHIQSFYEQVLARIGKLPGVAAAASSNVCPLTPSHSSTRFLVQGAPALPPGEYPVAQVRFVSPTYFETMGIALLAGRGFEPRDMNDPVGVIVVNQAFARRYLPERFSTTSKLIMGVLSPQPATIPVVGVVANARDVALDVPVEPEIYFPGYDSRATLLVRTSMPPGTLTPYIRQAVLAIDRNQPVYEIANMDAVLANSLTRPRVLATLLALFAGLALTLAAIGIYGVLAFSVVQRRREIGIRMALGARRSDVLGMVLRQGLILVLAGELSGLLSGLALGRLLRTLLFQVRTFDPPAVAASLALLALAGLLAIALPAWRAAQVDPIETLRTE
ncbi:MAG: FtsX-like permease family protein, partial [Acidobacteriota bacterium]|nr:FtsX-like permease family protein [Acidobacteriota bacterium]